MSSIDPPITVTPAQMALFSALFAIGVADAASGHSHAFDRASVIRASGTGRLVALKSSYAVQPSLGRVVMRSLDGKVDLPFDLSLLVDGVARPLSINHLQPQSKYELIADLPIELSDGTLASTLAFRLDGEALALELRAADATRAAEHEIALRLTAPDDGRSMFVSGVGEVNDSAKAKGSAAVALDEEKPYGFVSSRGDVALEIGFDEESGAPGMHRTIDTPPIAAGTGATDLFIVLGGGGSIWGDLFPHARQATERVFGQVTEQLGDAKRSETEIAHARVVGLDEDGKPRILAFADASGAFDVAAPLAVTEWYAALDSTQTSAPIRFVPGTKYALKLDVSPSGELLTKLTDGDSKAPVTARLIVHGIEGTLDPSFGPDYRASGAGPIIDALRGEAQTPLPAGRYRVCATKGIEWSIDCREISIEGGKSVTVPLEIRHVVPTPTMLGCDLHVHARPSFDTLVSTEDRVLSLVAAGIDFAVPTEHNIVGDYSTALAELDLTNELATVRGVEVTTYSPRFGHFGVFPYPGGKPVPPFRHSNPSAVFNAAHRGDPNRVVQVNHPRMGRGIGYFQDVGFDPSTGKVPPRMRLDFDSIEIYNGYEIAQPEKTHAVLIDYYALLNRGRKYVATGSSDSHHIQYQWAGYPRTIVDLGTQVSADHVDPLAVVAAVKAGHAIVTSGPIIEVDAQGVGPGGELQNPAAPIIAHVRVRAAPWIDVTSLELVVDGETVQTFEIASRPTKTGPEAGSRDEVEKRTLRFENDIGIPVNVTPKSWFLFIARGTRKLDDILPFMPVQPFAMTNPIWITRSGITGDRPEP